MQRTGRASLLSVLSLVAVGMAGCGSDASSRQARSPSQGSPYYESAVPQPRSANQGSPTGRPLDAPATGDVDIWVVPPGQPGGEAELNYEWNRVDAAYMNALKSFREEVTQLVESGEELERTRKALHLLAVAIEKIPGGSDAELSATAGQIRSDASQLSVPRQEGTGPAAPAEAQAQKRRTLRDALGAAAEQLVELAEGPYAKDPRVLEAARALEASVRSIPESDIIWTNNSSTYRALQQAEVALRSLGTAVASGRVSVGEAGMTP